MLKGVLLSLMASTLFGVMYFYTSLLTPLSSEQIFGWRMLLTIPIMALLIVSLGEWRGVRLIGKRLRCEPKLWLVLPLSSALLGVQLWLFMWAPAHGKALEVSLGYFMLPLTLVAMGRFVYREKLSALQATAVAFALFGVAHEVMRVGGFSWPSLLVCLGYPMYFYVRKHHHTDNLGGMWFDMLLTLPAALWFVLSAGPQMVNMLTGTPALYGLIPGLGLISSAALVCYIAASRLIPFTLFGLLGYAEPVLLVFVSLLLGETIGADEWLTYLPIWLAVGLLGLEGFLKFKRADLSANA